MPHTYVRGIYNLEPPVGFEPTTHALQVRCSGQLSYGGKMCVFFSFEDAYLC